MLAATLPNHQVACGVSDILMHTMDRYFNPVTDNDLTDELAEALLRVVLRNGPAAVQDPHDEAAMSEIMWAGSLSHNGLDRPWRQQGLCPASARPRAEREI